MEKRKLKWGIGGVVVRRVDTADKKWNIGIVMGYKRHHGLYEVRWADGQTRNHTRELLKHIA